MIHYLKLYLIFRRGIINSGQVFKCLTLVDIGNQYCLRNNKEALKFIKSSPIISKDKVLSRVKNRRENLDKRIIDIYRDHDLKGLYFEDFLKKGDYYEF